MVLSLIVPQGTRVLGDKDPRGHGVPGDKGSQGTRGTRGQGVLGGKGY